MKQILVLIFLCAFSLSALALPPSVEADRLLLQAKAALDAKDYAQATESLAKAEKLGIKLPDTFYFHYGRALAGTGDLERAQSMLERYLDKTGTKGKFYKEALDEMNNVEAAKKQKSAEEDRKAKQYAEAQARYEKNIADCEDHEYDRESQRRNNEVAQIKRKCDDTFYPPDWKGTQFGVCDGTSNHPLSRQYEDAKDYSYELMKLGQWKWCESQYQKPTPR